MLVVVAPCPPVLVACSLPLWSSSAYSISMVLTLESRVRAHLLKISGKGIRFCTKVTSTKFEELKKIDNKITLLYESKKSKLIPLPPLSNASELDSRKK
ncbi:hypothetical protein HN51_028915 [Arachis hypogaea]